MRQTITILLFTIPFALFGQMDSVDIWISKIDNASIAGTCHYAWVIEPTAKEVDKLIKNGKQTEKKLLTLLTNESRGIIAHYVLSNIYRQTTCRTLDMDTLSITYNYNGLQFVERNGRMQTTKLNLKKCKDDWNRKIRE